MHHRLVRGARRAAAVASGLALALGLIASCAADRAASRPTSTSGTSIGAVATALRVLQMNLCDSGRADCYSGGRAVSVAAGLVHHGRPTMVTVNEVCREDVRALKRAMSATFPAGKVASAFTPARDLITQAPVRCENGQQYGDGVLVVVSSRAHGFRRYSGVYPHQDPRDHEERVWVCIDRATPFIACTTHTASTSTTVALDQCRHLLSSVVPKISRRDNRPIIVGADLNLEADGSPSPQSCLPNGYRRTDDGALQDVVVSPGIEVRSRSVLDMSGATDHPGLLADVALVR